MFKLLGGLHFFIIVGVSASDKTLIVDKHNELRRLQPATDMELMVMKLLHTHVTSVLMYNLFSS